MGVTKDFLPVSIKIQNDINTGLSAKLASQKAKDWKLSIPEIKRSDNVQVLFQDVLDLISPTKSPIRTELASSPALKRHVNNNATDETAELMEGLQDDCFDLQGLILTNKQQVLGEGTTKVKLAVHQQTNRKVAVKIIEKKSLDTLSLQNLIRELLVLGGLTHDHIVPLLQVIDSPDQIYMVMEMETGGELFSYIVDKGKLSEDESVYIFRQIISAVDYFHSQDIVHRDLKPENIIMEGHGNVKIADFGFASLICANSRFEEFCGSPEYASPEMIARRSYIGPEVDIWSLGVILYVMVTGRMPFGASNLSVLFRSIMTGSYPMPQAVSEPLSDLIQSTLVVQVSRRAKLTDIRDHPWMSLGGKLPLLELCKPDSKPKTEQLSTEILVRLREFGFDQSQIDEYLNLGVPGPVKTAVYLLRESFSPRTLPYLPDPQSLKNPSTQIYDTLTYNLTPSPSPKSRSLLDKIKLFQESQYLDTKEEVQEPLRKNGPPITTTFLHESNREDTHLEILSKVMLEGGSIPRFEEEEHDVMYARVNLHKLPLGDLWDTADPELVACFKDSTESFQIDISVTTQPMENRFCTVVRLVSEEVPEWVIQEFDQFCIDLMKYVI